MEFAVSEPDGTRRWFEAVTEPLTSQDRTWGGVVAIRDVSERTMRLSLERLMAAAGHELKTPTAAIHNYLQLVDRHLDRRATSRRPATYAARALSPDPTPGHAHRAPPRRQPDPERPARAAARASSTSRRSSDRPSRSPRSCRRRRRSALTAGPRAGPRPGRPRPARAGVPQPPGQRDGARARLRDDRGDRQGRRRARRGRRPRPRAGRRGRGPPDDVRGLHAARPSAPGARAWASGCTSPARS